MNELSRHVALKLSRAESQIKSVCESIVDWATSNPLKAEGRILDDHLGFELILSPFAEAPPQDNWGLTVGECAHNLRSALDNLAFALARSECDPPPKPGKLSFPIYADKADFHSKERQNLEQWPAGAADLIESLQPFQRIGGPGEGLPADDPLLLLHWLNIIDKHRVPPIALIAPKSMSPDLKVDFYTAEEASLNVPPNMTIWGGALVPGATLLKMTTVSPLKSASIDFQCVAAVCILRDGEPLPIIHLLNYLYDYTKGVVSRFDSFFPSGEEIQDK